MPVTDNMQQDTYQFFTSERHMSKHWHTIKLDIEVDMMALQLSDSPHRCALDFGAERIGVAF